MLMLISACPNTTGGSLCGKTLITLVFFASFAIFFRWNMLTQPVRVLIYEGLGFSFGCSNGGFYSGTLTIDKNKYIHISVNCKLNEMVPLRVQKKML